MPMVLDVEPYHESFMPPMNTVPYFFRDRVLRNTPNTHTETQRFSVLRDSSLHVAVKHTQDFRAKQADLIWSFMNKVSGRDSTNIEKDLVLQYALDHFKSLGAVLSSKSWENYPKLVPFETEADPGEFDNAPRGEEERNAWRRVQKKWNKLYMEGKISRDTFHEASQTWRSTRNT